MAVDTRSKIHHVDDRCCFGSRDDVTLSIWRGAPTMDRIMAQRSVLERCLARYDQVYSLTAFRSVDMSMGQFSDERLRAEFDKLGKMMDGPLVAHALVIIGTGFIAATLRSATVSLGMVIRSRVVTKSFDDIYAGGKWLVTQRKGEARPQEAEGIEALLRSMTAQLDERAAGSTAAR
ncbi:MAG: hypothetical protein U0269_36300 [Polyangiales bacterium]